MGEAAGITGTTEDTVDTALRGLFSRDALFSLLWSAQLVSVAVATPFVTRVLGVAEFGQVATAVAVMQVLAIVAGLGLHTAIQRSYAADGLTGARRLLMFAVLSAVAVTALVEVTARWWGSFVGFSAASVELRLAVLSAGLLATVTFAQALLRSQDRMLAFGAVSVLLAFGAVGTGLVLTAAVAPTAQSYLVGQSSGQLVAAAVGLACCRPRPIRPRDRVLARRALLFALPLIPYGLNSIMLDAADRLIIADRLGSVAVARYYIAYSVGSFPLIAMSLVGWAWLPRLLTLSADVERPLVLAASRDALFRLVGPVVLGMCAGAPLVLRLWSPASFGVDDLLLITAIVVSAAVPYTAALTLENSLLAAGRSVPVAVAMTVTALANVGLNLVLIPVLGLVGSALATLLAFVILHLMMRVGGGAAAALPRCPVACRLTLAGTVGLGLATVAIPTTPAFLVLRALIVAATLAWFARGVLALVRPGPDDPRPAPDAAGSLS